MALFCLYFVGILSFVDLHKASLAGSIYGTYFFGMVPKKEFALVHACDIGNHFFDFARPYQAKNRFSDKLEGQKSTNSSDALARRVDDF